MSEHRPGIAILASGSGTTAEFFIHATQAGIVDAEVGLVISNKSEAGVFDVVSRLNDQYDLDIKTMHISNFTHPEGPGVDNGEMTLESSEAIAEEVARGQFAMVGLFGYMKKVRGSLLELDMLKVNTHPGILPYTRGLHGEDCQQWVLDHGSPFSAQTLQHLGDEYDVGETIAEHLVPVMPADTKETLFAAVQSTEKVHLPVDINKLLIESGLSDGR